MGTEERKARAGLRRHSAVITRVGLTDVRTDRDAVYGPAAMSLAWKLTREAWSLSRLPWPDYDRTTTPHCFKPE